MKIQVGWSDILFGKRQDPQGCMLARAIERRLGNAGVLRITKDNVLVHAGDVVAHHTLPADVQGRIRRFDKLFGKFFLRPFSFELHLRPVPQPFTVLQEEHKLAEREAELMLA